MHVVATAGHVDHGKSTLVRRLTAMEPDRWAEERRRGLSIDLGFAWTTLPSGEEIAIIDVPGHERFVSNMLAGVGAVPGALIIVAADEGWMPQTEEHVAALDALQVEHGLLVVSRTDLASPTDTIADARRRLARTSLAGVPSIAVSAVTGRGIDELTTALDALVARLPKPNPSAAARLWVDRSFVIGGAGLVVTGTLAVGSLRVGDQLAVSGTGNRVHIRGIQTLGREVPSASACARVALNLRGADRTQVRRGDILLADEATRPTAMVDVACRTDAETRPAHAMLHIGSAAEPVRVRRLGSHTARLFLSTELALIPGERGLLRDPGRHAIIDGITVLDPHPSPDGGARAARARGRELEQMTPRERTLAELGRRRILGADEVTERAMAPAGAHVSGWYVDPDLWSRLPAQIADLVNDWERDRPLTTGMPLEAARRALNLPDRSVLEAAATCAGLIQRDGVLTTGAHDELPTRLVVALSKLDDTWRQHPFVAPRKDELTDLGLGTEEIGAAVRAGRLMRIGDDVVLRAGSDEAAARLLSRMPRSTFTLSEARLALRTTRRVAVPLMELLDRQGRTRRLSPDLRLLLRAD